MTRDVNQCIALVNNFGTKSHQAVNNTVNGVFVTGDE